MNKRAVLLLLCVAVVFLCYSLSNILDKSEGKMTTWLPRKQATKALVTVKRKHYVLQNNDTNASRQRQFPRYHIGFVKVHKTGSSTIQNLLFRLGIRRKLNFVIPTEDNYFSRNFKSHGPILPIPNGSHYDILCHHAVFNKEVFSQLLPSDTSYIGIVREPEAQFISAANYYSKSVPYLKKALIRSRDKFISNLIRYSYKFERGFFTHTRNSMAHDFGFNNLHFVNSKFNERIKFLNNTFALVLVTEQFNESMVLLKRYLNWEFEDILYLPLNVNKRAKTVKLLDRDRNMLRKRNILDFQLYEFFSARLRHQIKEQEDKGFHEEVAQYKTVLNIVGAFCKGQNDTEKMITIPRSTWNERFTVSMNDCLAMQMNATVFQQKIRERHYVVFPGTRSSKTKQKQKQTEMLRHNNTLHPMRKMTMKTALLTRMRSVYS